MVLCGAAPVQAPLVPRLTSAEAAKRRAPRSSRSCRAFIRWEQQTGWVGVGGGGLLRRPAGTAPLDPERRGCVWMVPRSQKRLQTFVFCSLRSGVVPLPTPTSHPLPTQCFKLRHTHLSHTPKPRGCARWSAAADVCVWEKQQDLGHDSDLTVNPPPPAPLCTLVVSGVRSSSGEGHGSDPDPLQTVPHS